MIRSNYHTHSVFCDGKNSPEEMVQEALRLGMTHLGFSGHMDPDIHMDMPAYVQEIRRLQQKYAGQIDLLLGVELDNMYDPGCASEAEYIIGSTHFMDVQADIPLSVDNREEMILRLIREFYGGDPYAMAAAYYNLEARVYDRLHCTFVGHFDLITRFNDAMHFLDESDLRYLKPALSAMEYLVSQDVPFEINCGAYYRGRKKELYPNTVLLKALHEFGGRIFISSDAHQKEHLTSGFDHAAQAAAACGFRQYLILEHDEHGHVAMREMPL